MAYRIRNWNKHFENHKTRLLKNLAWIPLPTDLGSQGYAQLVAGHPDGAAHFGFWIAMLEMAARGEPRGHLTAGTRHHDARSMSLMCRMPETMIETALERLVSIGWVETWHHEDTLVPDQAPDPALSRPDLALQGHQKGVTYRQVGNSVDIQETHTHGNGDEAPLSRKVINLSYAKIGKGATSEAPTSYTEKITELTIKYGHPLPPHAIAEFNEWKKSNNPEEE